MKKAPSVSRPLRVLHVLTDTNIGGAGMLLCNLLANADAAAVSYSVLLPAKSRLLSYLCAGPGFCNLYTYPGGKDRSFSLADILSVRRVIAALHPDVVHTHASLSARIAARLFPGRYRPLVCTTHHCVFPLKKRQKTGIYRAFFRWGARLFSDGTIAVAPVAKEELVELGMPAEDICVIVNGVNPVRRCSEEERQAATARYGILPGDFVVGMPARLERYKGQETVLQAAELCRLKNPRIRFLFIGDGSCREEYARTAAEKNLGECVRFCGFVADMAPLYALMNVNLNASVGTETASLALSEGMSLGIPAVASDAGGNPAMVHPGENGELFPAGDSKALAVLLLHLAADPERCAALGRGAAARYKRDFGAVRMARETEAYYRKLCARKKRASAKNSFSRKSRKNGAGDENRTRNLSLGS